VESGLIKSLTSFFAVPKGDDDVRIVYDGTKSGLNGVLWAPWFHLPTVESHLRCLSPGYFMRDLDFGEQFHYFMMHESMRVYAGIDFTQYFPEDIKPNHLVLWERWFRLGMGFLSSPCISGQGAHLALELIRDKPDDPDNIFKWDHVRLNLPGNKNYDPSEPWVSKVTFNASNSKWVIANDVMMYVDDLRTIGRTYEDCRMASRRVGSELSYLILQDAACKCRDPLQIPAPWAGSSVQSEGGEITVCITQPRWDKVKAMLDWIETSLHDPRGIEHKTLESYRGTLNYISRTYPVITPYLKGIHLTLDSWRPWRAEDAWKLSLREIGEALLEKDAHGHFTTNSAKPPNRVMPAPRLEDDISALKRLFSADTPTA
jgi:hypothetical protein